MSVQQHEVRVKESDGSSCGPSGQKMKWTTGSLGERQMVHQIVDVYVKMYHETLEV